MSKNVQGKYVCLKPCKGKLKFNVEVINEDLFTWPNDGYPATGLRARNIINLHLGLFFQL